MTMLYALSFSRYIKGFAATVRTTPRMLCGHFNTETLEIVGPDLAAVRAAMPYHWRKAFDREICLWFPRDGDGPATMTLRDSRGHYLITLYARPYYFTPKA